MLDFFPQNGNFEASEEDVESFLVFCLSDFRRLWLSTSFA